MHNITMNCLSRPRRSLILLIICCVLNANVAAANAAPRPVQTDPAQPPSMLRLGVLRDPVQAALSEIVAVFLEEQAYQVARVPLATTDDMLNALTAGTIDLALALPVDALTTHYQLPLNALPTDQARLQQLVGSLGMKEEVVWSAAALAQRQQTVWAAPAVAEQIPTSADLSTVISMTVGMASTICAPASQAGPLQGLLAGLAEEHAVTVPDDAIQLLPAPHSTSSASEQGTTSAITSTAPLTATTALTTTIVPTTQVAVTATSAPSVTQPNAAPIETDTTNRTDTVEPVASLSSCDLFFDLSPSLTISGTALRPLPDLAPLFPANYPTLVYATGIDLETRPFFGTLDQVLTAIDEQVLTALVNETITADGEERVVATEWAYRFLLDRDLIALPTVTVGARGETAQTLLAAMVAQLLEEQGYRTFNLTGQLPLMMPGIAVTDGTLDLAIALTGDLELALGNAAGTASQDNSPAAVVARFNERQSESSDVSALAPAPFSLTQLLLVDADLATLGITDLSTLADYMNRYDAPLGICMDSDFFSHPTAGLSQVEVAYGFQFQPEKILLMDDDSLFPAINEGRCQVTVGTVTDGRIKAWNLVALADDQDRFFPNNPLPVIDRALLARHPNLEPLLGSLLARLDAATMQQMTAQVELGNDGSAFSGDEETPETVARRYLVETGLIGEDEGGELDGETVGQ